MGNITVRLDEGDLVADCSIVRMNDVEGKSPFVPTQGTSSDAIPVNEPREEKGEEESL
jgi:hypothetical protein